MITFHEKKTLIGRTGGVVGGDLDSFSHSIISILLYRL